MEAMVNHPEYTGGHFGAIQGSHNDNSSKILQTITFNDYLPDKSGNSFLKHI